MAFKYLRYRFVLMRPYNKVKELRDHPLSYTVAPTDTQVHAFVLVLVQNENVKPIVFVFEWSFKLNAFIFKRHVESLILHVANSIQCYLC